MNIKRFLARTPREAMALVRQAFGSDAVVMSTKPSRDGVEMLAMAPDSVLQLDAIDAPLSRLPEAPESRLPEGPASRLPEGPASRLPEGPASRLPEGPASRLPEGPASRRPDVQAEADVHADVERLAMSTLSFQDYVRERMLKRRLAEQRGGEPRATVARDDVPVLRDEPAAAPTATPLRDDVLAELRSMRGLIEERFSALAFIDRLQRRPAQARLAGRLLDAGFSPALVKKLAEALPHDATDELGWAAGVLERNLPGGEAESPLEDCGGVYALVGATGVGKTTSTAKIAAAFAMKHGAGALGLITLDAYRLAAHEQLRAYGRILGVPVHTAHDRASLEDLLDLLSGKRMVLIDTAGTAQRDARTRELLDMLSHRSIHRLLVVNAAAQGETIDDVMAAYRAAGSRGAVLSKIDEAVKLGPALDALIRHKLPVLGVANGQRVPEDWHRLSSHALVSRALRERPAGAWRLDAGDLGLVFAGAAGRAVTQGLAHA